MEKFRDPLIGELVAAAKFFDAPQKACVKNLTILLLELCLSLVVFRHTDMLCGAIDWIGSVPVVVPNQIVRPFSREILSVRAYAVSLGCFLRVLLCS